MLTFTGMRICLQVMGVVYLSQVEDEMARQEQRRKPEKGATLSAG